VLVIHTKRFAPSHADVLVQPIANTIIGYASGKYAYARIHVYLIARTLGISFLPANAPFPAPCTAAGILFILATKQVLGGSEAEEEAEELGPDKLNVGWEKMVLIMFVMTLHSLTEGVGECWNCACVTSAPQH
jgi:hypothetical protein